MLQTAQLLRDRVGQVDLVECVRRRRADALAVDLDHAGLHTDHGRVGRHFLQHDGIRTDAAVVAHLKRAEHLGAGRNQHIVANGRVALAGIVARAAERHAVVDRAVVTDLGGFADHDAHAVVDEQAAADGRARVDLDAGQVARKLGKPARKEKTIVLVEPVRLPVQDERMEALVKQKDLKCGARSGIAVADRARVVKQALENHKTYILSFGYEIRTLSIIAGLREKFKPLIEISKKSGIMNRECH